MLLAAFLALSLIASPKPDFHAPREGVEPCPDLHRGGFSEFDARPLSAIGDDVLRVTSAPVLAGHGYVRSRKC